MNFLTKRKSNLKISTMGYVFWYIGNGSQIGIFPRSVSIFHREYFVNFRQEELTITTDRIILNLKGGYLTDIELVNENAEKLGTYYVAFTGMNLIYLNGSLLNKGWKFGVGPGVLTSKIYNYTDYAITLNGAVVGNLENGEVLLLVENLGYGKTIPTPSVYFRGLTDVQNFKLGPYVRFFGDIDIDAGFVLSANYGVFGINASPSLKNLIAGFSLDVGTFTFRYDYEYYWIGYFTHRIGFNIFWGKQKELEEKIERHERILAEHEEEIKSLKRRVEELEKGAKDYAKNLVESAKNDKDPESALMKLQIAMAFDSVPGIEGMIDSLNGVIKENKKRGYISRINTYMRNKLYSDALAEALLFLEEFSDDRDALRVYNDVKNSINKLRNSQSVEAEANQKYDNAKIRKIDILIERGDYVEAAKILNTIPQNPDRVKYINKLRAVAERYLSEAKGYIQNKDWVKAKYYLEKSLKIYPLPEASGLLTYVEANMKRDANYYYLKSLEMYQKGDVSMAFAYIKEAFTLDPNNEKYRNVYFRLKNVLRED
ncbi:MAG: hypothetical protein ABIL16_05200 [candidate division WOR-3 bacterium]